WRNISARPARFGELPNDLNPALRIALQGRGVRSLYIHQIETWDHVRRGENVVIVTGTASGKTLCYNLPVINHLLEDPQARALYLFPTKALAQDQYDGLAQLLSRIHSDISSGGDAPRAAIYDGDTPSGQRQAIRTQAQVVISNPDMLHTGILPHHTLWAEFFRHLRFVVVDEIHTYRGVFGSHVANVMRRLKRVAAFYGSYPQFILTSATIANPVELSECLVELPVELVDQDGAPRGARQFLVYNPPIVNRELGIRRSSLLESVKLASQLTANHIQTIMFGRTRRTVELLLNYLRQNTSGDRTRVRGYRSGYLATERREIERGLRDSSINAVVATSALELGIDIGSMQASVLVGYPGTIAATLQQAGRAGRTRDTSLSVFVTSADPLDQFLAHHPEYLFERTPEKALINPDNLIILLHHLRCATFELPFRRGEPFGRVPLEDLCALLNVLEEGGELYISGDRFFWMADQYPADHVSLRSASPESVLLQVGDGEGSHLIGQVDQASAAWLVHPDAVYLHDGVSYLVEDLDLEHSVAELKRMDVDYYTEPRRETTVERLSVHQEANVLGGAKAHGEIRVMTQVVGYRKIRWYTHEHLGGGNLSLPPSQLQTTGYWLSLNESTVADLRDQGLWTNDANNYGPNWPSQRDRARQRDQYRCQICGIAEVGRSHHVHHKTPFRTFASYEHANQLDNLVTLCPTCHRLAEQAVRMRSGLAGLAYILGQLAPLFLMCDSRDLGVHSDPQSQIAEGLPALVIYDEAPAGIGLSEKLFDVHDELIFRAVELVNECKCTEGCPSCTGPAGEAGEGGKQETMAILELLWNHNRL
ncbi:MAG: DEAD/DEAH box helicase, partial [Anaerolineaceae bacterium]|nr:DEAD/DEAH box helicase [Anaerolineaceae bacterium]